VYACVHSVSTLCMYVYMCLYCVIVFFLKSEHMECKTCLQPIFQRDGKFELACIDVRMKLNIFLNNFNLSSVKQETCLFGRSGCCKSPQLFLKITKIKEKG
jgi:hypothetical protein